MKTQTDSWSLFRLSDRKQFDRVPLLVVEYLHKLLPEAETDGWMFWRAPMVDWQPLSRLPAALRDENAAPQIPVPPPIPETNTSASSKSEIHDSVSRTTRTKGTAVSHANTKTQVDSIVRSSEVSSESEIKEIELTLKPRKKTVARLQPAAAIPQPKVISMATGEQTLSLMLESKLASEDRSMVRYQKRFKIRIPLADGSVFESVTVDASQSGLKLRDPLPEGLPRFFNVEFDCGTEGKIPLMCSVIKERDGKTPYRLRIQVNDFQNKLKSALMRAA